MSKNILNDAAGKPLYEEPIKPFGASPKKGLRGLLLLGMAFFSGKKLDDESVRADGNFSNIVNAGIFGAAIAGPIGAGIASSLAASINYADASVMANGKRVDVNAIKWDELFLKDDPIYGGTVLHRMIAAEGDQESLTLINRFPDLAREGDNGNRTPLLLAMAVNSDEELIKKLITPETVIMNDKNGRSPIEYAATFASPEIFRSILEEIPKEHISSLGKKIKTALNISAKSRAKFCEEFVMNCNRDENASLNFLFVEEGCSILFGARDRVDSAAMEKDLGLSLASSNVGTRQLVGILSTRKNLEVLKRIEKSGTPGFWEKLGSFIGESSDSVKRLYLTEYIRPLHGQLNYNSEEFWHKVKNADLSKFSGESLEDLYKKRAESKKKIFADFRSQIKKEMEKEEPEKESSEKSPSRQVADTTAVAFSPPERQSGL
jgi:hypothetical protein